MSGGARISAAEAVGAALRKHSHLTPDAGAFTRFDDMMEAERGAHSSDELAIRQEAVADMINWCWEGGLAGYERAVKRFFTYTREYRAELVANVTCEQMAALFGEGRAAESARTGIIEKTLKGAGYRHTQLPSGKSETACAKMSKAQLGNKHRARSVKKRAIM